MAVLATVLVVAPAGPAAAATNSPAIGIRPHYKLHTQKLSDRLDINVNLANGNLVVHALDLQLKGRAGHDFTIERYHNSLGGAVSSMRANGWTFGAVDAWLDTSFADGSVSYHDPSGYSVAIEKVNGTYVAPAGLEATLEQLSTSRWRLTFYRTGEKYVFDQEGSPGKALLVEHLDRNNNKITVGHVNDSFGRRPSTITDSRGKTTTIQWQNDGTNSWVDHIDDPVGARNLYGFEDSRNLSYHRSGTEYDVYHYDSAGRITSIELSVHETLFQTATVARFTYDSEGRVTSITNPNGPDIEYTTTFSYKPTATSPHTVVRDANGHDTTHYYDSQGRVTKTVDAKGNTTSTSYTSNHNVASFTDALSAAASANYDANNNLSSLQLPSGAAYQWNYSDQQQPYQPSSYTDPQGNTSGYTYDTPGNLKAAKDPLQNEVSLTYNPDGTPSSMKDAKGTVTNFTYDATTGDIVGIDYPAPLGDNSMATDVVGRLASLTDGKGNTTTFSYDVADRLTEISYADGTVVSYDYDLRGNLIKRVLDGPDYMKEIAPGVFMSAGKGATRWITYDNLNRPIEIVGPKFGVEGDTSDWAMKARASYDAVGNLVEVRYSNGPRTHLAPVVDIFGEMATGQDPQFEESQWIKIRYTYDEVNLVTSVTEPGENETDPPLTTRFDYDENYRRRHTYYPNGVTLAVEYEKSGRQDLLTATGPDGNILAKYDYSYTDENGNDTTLRQKVVEVGADTTTYDYDQLNRLTAATNSSSSYLFTYDANSNRTRKTVNGKPTDYTYNAANQLTSVVGGPSFTYDANGNLTSDGNHTYTYNEANQLVAVDIGQEAERRYEYADAGQSRRIGIDDTFLFEGFVGGVDRSFDDTTEPTGIVSSVTQYTRDPYGNLTTLRLPATAGSDAGETSHNYYYLFDGLGSVIGLTDAEGNLAATYTYDPDGNQLNSTQPGLSAAEQVENPWRYASGYHEPLTGLTKFGERYYNPATARWTQQDPLFGNLSAPTTLNRYIYAGCNPVNYTDPSGASHCEILRKVSAIVGLTFLAATLLAPTALGTILVASVGVVFGGIAILAKIQAGCYGPTLGH